MRIFRGLGRGVLFAALPLLVYLALQHFEPRVVALFLLATLLLRAPGKAVALAQRLGWRGAVLAGALALVILLMWRSNDPAWALAYPVLMSAVMLGIFAASLLRPPSVVERIARLRTPDLPPEGIAYARRVTQVWCGFFLVNGGIATWTVFAASREAWLLYNGLLSYLLMGSLFAAEWLYRRQRFGVEASR